MMVIVLTAGCGQKEKAIKVEDLPPPRPIKWIRTFDPDKGWDIDLDQPGWEKTKAAVQRMKDGYPE